MKNLYQTFFQKLAILIILACCAFQSNAQIINNEINYEIRVDQLKYDGVGDGAGNAFEPTISVDIKRFNGQWRTDICEDHFSGTSLPYLYTNNTASRELYWATGAPFNAMVDIYFRGWESDNAPDCTYNSTASNPDDDYYQGYGVFTNGSAGLPLTDGGRGGLVWHSGFNSATGGWLLPNTSVWDIKLKAAWRHTSGDNCSDPLRFGTLNNNQTYSNFNNNSRAIESEHSGGVSLTYTNTANNPSPDVYYSFVVNSTMEVEINTTNTQLNTDTYLRLFNSNCGNMIAENDDVSGSIRQSRIVETLTLGTYIVQVEGYSAVEGPFKLEVKGTNIVPTGTKDMVNVNETQIYPNPASELVNIDLGFGNFEGTTLRIRNILGQLVYSYDKLESRLISIDVSGFERGAYFVELNNNDNRVIKKIIVE